METVIKIIERWLNLHKTNEPCAYNTGKIDAYEQVLYLMRKRTEQGVQTENIE